MSTPQPQPAPAPPADDSRASSIAWAVAVTVVALVVGLIAWLALGGQGEGARGPSTPSATVPSAPPGATGDSEATATEDDASAQTPPEEVQQLLLGLQRRDAGDPMAVGAVDAPVVMIEYADYRCPYCARFALETRPALQHLVDEGVLRIEFRDFVIFDEQSHDAAVAARAAAAQGLLEPYQEAVFALSTGGHAELDRPDLVDLAEGVGVPDLAAFEEALDDPALAAAVDADTAEARSLGLGSTPTFVVNTSVVQGAQSVDHFEAVIAQEQQRPAARD